MPSEGQTLQLFRALGTTPQQMTQLLQPLGGQMPTNEADFNNVCMSIRRYGHITENHPNNIGQALSGPMRAARPGAYHTNEQHNAPGSADKPPSNSYTVQTWAHGSPLVHDPHNSLPPLWEAPTYGNSEPPQVQQRTWFGQSSTQHPYQSVQQDDDDDDDDED